MPWTKTAKSAAAKRRVLRSSAVCESSLSLASKEGGRETNVGWSEIVGEERDLPYAEVRGDGRKRSGCREPKINVRFPRRAECSSDSGSSR